MTEFGLRLRIASINRSKILVSLRVSADSVDEGEASAAVGVAVAVVSVGVAREGSSADRAGGLVAEEEAAFGG